jgi:predicted  nucleic acid-binding Zn-ribbon protein
MSQREPQTSAGTSAVLPSPAGERSAGTPEKGGRMRSWEDFFRNAPAEQQAELLALARAQGILYAHRLPARPHANPGTQAAEELAGVCVLSRLLAGRTADLQPVRPGDVALLDTALDASQRAAVARALATPDICLIQGLPGTGKSRVVAEIITQAAQRSQRILLLAPSGAALDRVLETLADQPVVCGLRCLGREESLENLSPVGRALTLRERARLLREQTLPAAKNSLIECERRLTERTQEEKLWPDLLDLAQARERLAVQATELRGRIAAVPDEVAAEASRILAAEQGAANKDGALAAALSELLRCHHDKCHDLETARAKVEQQGLQKQQEVRDLAAQMEAIRPLAQAKRNGRWWSLAWWRATLRGGLPQRLATLEAEYAKAAADLADVQSKTEAINRQLQQEEVSFHAACRREEEAEIGRRQATLADQEAALQHELELLEAKANQLLGRLASESPRPQALTLAAIRQAQEQWQALRQHDLACRDLAQQWAAYLETSAEQVATEWPAYANLVAAPLSCLRGEPVLDGAGPFDLLILEEADRVSEADLLQASRRARRWVLVGEPAPEMDGCPSPSRPAAGLAPGCFQRLWDHLHCDPSRLPYAWVREGDRLCCRLYPVPADQRQRLERESVADFPDVELRIFTPPRAKPVLAEVLFPAGMSVHQAKGYLYRELEELPVQAIGRSACWDERPDAVVFRLGSCDSADAVPVELEQGVRELVAAGTCGQPLVGTPPPWHTCRVEFDRACGWQRERAEEWVQQRLRLRDLGRTATLEKLHRMTPPLAYVISDLLWQGAGLATGDGNDPLLPARSVSDGPPAVEFVPVPPLERGRGRHQRAGQLPRAGAGLELDLTAPRHAERLPSELRLALPGAGLVNYFEARAVVRRLAELAGDPALRAAAAPCQGPTVAIMALQPAQVALLRELVRQCSEVGQAGLDVEIGLPHTFRQRECRIALVSLTRSHSHRAVALAESPEQLVLALTRPKERLVLFGDIGTLARRAQWQGALDHLNEAAAAREGRLIAGLVRYLHGLGRHSRAFWLGEGNGS